MHEILTDHPGWRQLAADRAKLTRAEAVHRHRTATVTAEREKALARHAKQYQEAILDGVDPPPPPQLGPVDLNLADATRLLIGRGRELDDRERQFLTGHAATLERQLAARHTELLAEARPAVTKLEAVADELQSLTSAAQSVRAASGDRHPVAEGRITAARVAEAVAGRQSFLQLDPVAPTTVYSTTVYPAPVASAGDDDGVALFTPEAEPPVTRMGDARLDGRR